MVAHTRYAIFNVVMTESLIEDLEIQSYGENNPRAQEGTVGERSAIREIDPTDRVDVQRIFDIDRQEGVLKFMVGDPKTEQESIDWAKKEVHMFAVSGAVENAPVGERGELQGWVWFGNDEKERLERAQNEGLLTLSHGAQMLEVSFAKYDKAEPGQMAGGLRQACHKLWKDNVINNALERPNIVVTAYTSSQNPDSINVLESAGFVAKGNVIYDPKESIIPDVLYVLDWSLLNTILHQNVDRALFGDLPGYNRNEISI